MNDLQCPHCGHHLTADDLPTITFWGRDEPQEIDCPACDAELLIAEHVTRTWSIVAPANTGANFPP